MKKLLSIIACCTILATVVSADFTHMEMGEGVWMNTPSIRTTYIKEKSTYISDETASTNVYVWISVKQSVSVIPNIRLEYVSTEEEGKVKGDFEKFKTLDFANVKSTLTQFDLIPYYNIFDKTGKIMDLGLGIKFIKSGYIVSATRTFSGYSREGGLFYFPFLYIRVRAQTAIKNISIESDAKVAIAPLGVDIRTKVDYTLDFIANHPTIELGYRIQEDSSNVINASGVYAGLNLRF